MLVVVTCIATDPVLFLLSEAAVSITKTSAIFNVISCTSPTLCNCASIHQSSSYDTLEGAALLDKAVRSKSMNVAFQVGIAGQSCDCGGRGSGVDDIRSAGHPQKGGRGSL